MAFTWLVPWSPVYCVCRYFMVFYLPSDNQTNFTSMPSRVPPSLTRTSAVPSLTFKVPCRKCLLIPRSPMSKRRPSMTCAQNTVLFCLCQCLNSDVVQPRKLPFPCQKAPAPLIVLRTVPTPAPQPLLTNVSTRCLNGGSWRNGQAPCTIVAKSNGSPRFCVDYRHTLNRHIIRKSWPMPNLESCLGAVPAWMPLGTHSTYLSPTSSARSGSYRWQKSTSTEAPSSPQAASTVLNACPLE